MQKKQILSGFLWRLAERLGAQGVKLIIEVILARILMPEDYGIIALVSVFINILNVFVDSGLVSALIQKKDADDLDFSSVFWFNVAGSILLYLMLFLFAPSLAAFYGRDELTLLIRVLGIQILISGLKSVQYAYVSKCMQFKQFFFATLGGTVGAAFIGIIMAYNGYGVWALAVQHVFNSLIDTIILWIAVKWRPTCKFSTVRFKRLYYYGWKILASTVINSIYSELRQLVIGKMYTTTELAYFNKGGQFPSLFINNINSSIDSVLFPAFSYEQDNKERVRHMLRRSIMVSNYLLDPLLIGLAFVSEPFVRLILTDKWLPCVPFMRIFCIVLIFYPIHTANMNAIKAMGRSDLLLKMEIAKKIIGISALVITMHISVMAMAYSMIVTSALSQIINSWPNKELLDYKLTDQLRDIIPCMLLSVAMGICVFCVSYLGMNDILTLLLQVVLGATIYVVASALLKMESFQYIRNAVIIGEYNE